MTAGNKIARRKLSLLELAEDLNNVSKACKVMGYSRQQFYEIRRNFQTYGSQGLVDRLPGAKNPHPNRVPQPIEKAILAHALEFPTHGCLRVAQELAPRETNVSPGGVRGVWKCHNLLTKHQRLPRLEKHVQGKLLERFNPRFREHHIEAPYTGSLLAVDTFFVGHLKGVGRIYAQTAILTNSSSSSKASNTEPPKSGAPRATASLRDSTGPCPVNTSESKEGRNGMTKSRKCKKTSMITSSPTIPSGLTKAAA